MGRYPDLYLFFPLSKNSPRLSFILLPWDLEVKELIALESSYSKEPRSGRTRQEQEQEKRGRRIPEAGF